MQGIIAVLTWTQCTANDPELKSMRNQNSVKVSLTSAHLIRLNISKNNKQNRHSSFPLEEEVLKYSLIS